jgi:hypothetical protein
MEKMHREGPEVINTLMVFNGRFFHLPCVSLGSATDIHFESDVIRNALTVVRYGKWV